MTAEGADKIGVFDFLVEIADKGTSGEVAACDFVEGAFLLRACCRVEDCHHAVHSTYSEKLLDCHVVFLRTDEREQFPFQIIAPGIFIYQSLRTCIERNADDLRTFSFGLLWHIFYGSVDYACRSHSHEVGHTATDKTLKDEDVALSLQ